MNARSSLLPIFAATLFAAGCQTSRDPVPLAGPVIAPPPPPPAAAPLPPAPPPTSVASVTSLSGLAPVPAEQRVPAALIVRDAARSADPAALAALSDWLQSAFGSGRFAVRVPRDVGADVSEAAALRLAEQLGCTILLDSSVTSARVRHVRGTDPGEQAVFEFSLFAKAVPSGELLAASGLVQARSRIVTSSIEFEENEENLWMEAAQTAAFDAVPKLDAAYVAANPRPAVPAAVRVLFAANVPGANVRIDDASYGTIGSDPLSVSVSPGLHDIEIAYPGMEPIKDRAMIQDGSAFVTRLVMTEEASLRAKQDAYFAAVLDRVRKSGRTDDLVRELVAKGYARYLSSSHARLDGMPQSLQIGGDAPSLGLDGGSPARAPEMPSTDDLLKAAFPQTGGATPAQTPETPSAGDLRQKAAGRLPQTGGTEANPTK